MENDKNDFLSNEFSCEFWMLKNSQEIQGVGATRRGEQATIQIPSAALQPKITNGVPRPTVTVPKVNPAAFD